jgi:hypothetical protein
VCVQSGWPPKSQDKEVAFALPHCRRIMVSSSAEEGEILRLLCARTQFSMAELWAFGSGSTGLDASVSMRGDKSRHDRSLHRAAGLARSGSRGSLTDLAGAALSRSNTGMSAFGSREPRNSSLYFTGVDCLDAPMCTIGRSTSRESAMVEQGAACSDQHRHFRWVGEHEDAGSLFATLEQKRLDTVLARGQGLAGKIWQSKRSEWHILQHLYQDPEYPQDDLLPVYAKLFSAVLGVPILNAEKSVQGVVMLFLPYSASALELAAEAAAAAQYLDEGKNPHLYLLITQASQLLSAVRCAHLCQRRRLPSPNVSHIWKTREFVARC